MKSVKWTNRLCRKIILQFANAENGEKAVDSLKNHLRCYLDIDNQVYSGGYDALRTLMSEASRTTDLNQCPTIHDYTAHYLMGIRPEIVVRSDGTLGEDKPFRAKAPDYRDILTYCVIKFFSNEKYVKRLFRCENYDCGKFYLAKRANPKTGPKRNRFCCDACRFDFHYEQKQRIRR